MAMNTRLRNSLLAGLSVLAVSGANAQALNKSAKITVGWAEPIDTLNPATTSARNQGALMINIFDPLVWLTPDFKTEPLLATKWSITADGLTYSFTLREDVQFHDGTAFDAEAVVENIKYITHKETPSKVALTLLGPCKEAVATGKYTVDIKCGTPYAPLLTQLGAPYLGMQSPAAIAKYGKDLGLHPTGTGPYVFVSYEPNQSLVVRRNEAYNWNPASVGHKGPPNLAEIRFQIVPNAQARVSQFQSGQSQMIQQTPGVHWNAMQKMDRFTAIPVPISGLGVFAPINAQKFPTDDVAVRRAIQYAIDKKAVIQLAEAGAFPPSLTPLQPSMTAYNKSLEAMYPFDPAKAEATLAEGGWAKKDGFWEKDGKRLALTITAISTSTSYPLLAQAMQNYLQKIGIEASVQLLAQPAWMASNVNGDTSITPTQFIGLDADALSGWFTAGQFYNWSRYSNPKLDVLFKQGREETDATKRVSIYRDVQKILMDEAIILPIRQNIDLVMTSKKLTGVIYSGGGFEYFGAASLAD
jgi:peptide/nickel transport system substrate-binding protein